MPSYYGRLFAVHVLAAHYLLSANSSSTVARRQRNKARHDDGAASADPGKEVSQAGDGFLADLQPSRPPKQFSKRGRRQQQQQAIASATKLPRS